MICDYGCGRKAKFVLIGLGGVEKHSCEKSCHSCPAMKKKRSEQTKARCAAPGYVHSSKKYFEEHGKGWNKDRQIHKKYGKMTDDELFIENSKTKRGFIRREAIRRGILKEICSECSNDGNWRGKKLTIQLHHKNGIENDNRKENLDMLCPNCHCVTDSWANPNN